MDAACLIFISSEAISNVFLKSKYEMTSPIDSNNDRTEKSANQPMDKALVVEGGASARGLLNRDPGWLS